MDHSPAYSDDFRRARAHRAAQVAKKPRSQQSTPPTLTAGGAAAARLPIFLVDGLSHGKDHPDLKSRLECTCRGTLPTCTLEESGGFLYLRKDSAHGQRRTAPRGDIIWIKSGLHSATLSMLDRFESPWRRRGKTTALQDGETTGIPCWAYFPEHEPRNH